MKDWFKWFETLPKADQDRELGIAITNFMTISVGCPNKSKEAKLQAHNLANFRDKRNN